MASSVARRAIGLRPPIDAELLAEVAEDFAEATRRAETLVAEVTGLHPEGSAKSLTVEREAWVDANIASFSRLLGPALERTSEKGAGRALLAPLSRQAAGLEVGLLLSWLSSRVLGQYDAVPGRPEAADSIYYVAPNIVQLERRHGFAPKDFRLWIAVHEVTHRMQFRGVEWLEGYFLDLVDRGTSISFDSGAVLDALTRAVGEVRSGRNPLAEGGIVGLLASGEQLATVHEAQAFMSLLEGHADIVMGAVGDDVIPGATRFATTLAARRTQAKSGTKFVQQLLGLEAKLRQYKEGEGFVEAIIRARGMDGFSRVWESPAELPTLEEIRDPERWLARVDGGAPRPA